MGRCDVSNEAAFHKPSVWTLLMRRLVPGTGAGIFFEDGTVPTGASNFCAMPAASAGMLNCDGCVVDTITNSFAGPWCYCRDKNSGFASYCKAPKNKPVRPPCPSRPAPPNRFSCVKMGGHA